MLFLHEKRPCFSRSLKFILILTWGHTHNPFEVAVKSAKRVKPTIQGGLKYCLFGVVSQDITSFVDSVPVYVIGKGYANTALKIF